MTLEDSLLHGRQGWFMLSPMEGPAAQSEGCAGTGDHGTGTAKGKRAESAGCGWEAEGPLWTTGWLSMREAGRRTAQCTGTSSETGVERASNSVALSTTNELF